MNNVSGVFDVCSDSTAHGKPLTRAMQVTLDEAAVTDFVAAIGDENVIIDNEILEQYAASTGLKSVRALAVLRPADTDEVSAVVRVASRHTLSLYPISRGRNWGYGDACPVVEGQVILDLGRMNRIVEVNDELAYAVIEPGVTQGELSSYLRERHPCLWVDSTGAGPDVSIVGNILDRGFGHTPYGNRFQTVCGLEVVLGNGEILKTGTGHYFGSRVRWTYPYGVGPYLDGIFTQSNFGIVTRLGLWLIPRPEHVSIFVASAKKDQDIVGLVDALRRLRMDGTVRSVVHLGNDLRVISSGQTFPFDVLPDRSSLTHEIRERLRLNGGIAHWTAVGALYGDRRQVAASTRRLRKALSPFKIQVLTERRLAKAKSLTRLLGSTNWGNKLARRLATAEALFDLNKGIPTRRFLTGAYWRRRGGIPAEFPDSCNPATEGCSFLWLSPTLPATGRDALALKELVAPILERHDFDFFVTYSLINERSLGAVMTLCFDRSDRTEVARAGRCYDEMFRAVVDAGYVPYRVGTQSMASLALGSAVFWDVAAKLKKALDPDSVIAPGRYEPAAAGAGHGQSQTF